MEETQVQENIATPEVASEPNPQKKKNYKAIILATIIVVVALVLAILIMSSKPVKIHKLSKFTKSVEQEYATYSTSELEKAEAKFEKYVKKLDKCELNGRQEEKVNNLKVECRNYFTQAKARIILQDFQNAVDAAGDEVKGAINSMQRND